MLHNSKWSRLKAKAQETMEFSVSTNISLTGLLYYLGYDFLNRKNIYHYKLYEINIFINACIS